MAATDTGGATSPTIAAADTAAAPSTTPAASPAATPAATATPVPTTPSVPVDTPAPAAARATRPGPALAIVLRATRSRGPRPVAWLRRRVTTTRTAPADTGMATAEYAIATVAAAGFAGLLVVILRSGEVRELLLGIIRSALSL